MGRLEKKCLMGSLLTHAALIGALLFGSAFLKSKPPELPPQSNILELVKLPDELTDGESRLGGGGQPAPAPPPPVEQRQPEPEPPPARPEPPVVQPEPPRPTVVEPVRPVEPPPVPQPKKLEPKKQEAKKVEPKKAVEAPKPPPEKPKIQVNLKTVTVSRSDAKAKRDEELRKQRERERQQAERQKNIAKNISRSLDNLQNNLSAVSTVDVSVQGSSAGSGWGGSGPTLVNYAQWVKEIYDRNWIVTDAVKSDDGIVKVEIVVQRNGDARGRIIRKSGDALLDRSVQAALDRVRNIGYAFPKDATDSSRTFIINFNLNSRRQAG